MRVTPKKKERVDFGCDSLQVLEFNKERVEGVRLPFPSLGIGPRASVNWNQMLHQRKCEPARSNEWRLSDAEAMLIEGTVVHGVG